MYSHQFCARAPGRRRDIEGETLDEGIEVWKQFKAVGTAVCSQQICRNPRAMHTLQQRQRQRDLMCTSSIIRMYLIIYRSSTLGFFKVILAYRASLLWILLMHDYAVMILKMLIQLLAPSDLSLWVLLALPGRSPGHRGGSLVVDRYGQVCVSLR